MHIILLMMTLVETKVVTYHFFTVGIYFFILFIYNIYAFL